MGPACIHSNFPRIARDTSCMLVRWWTLHALAPLPKAHSHHQTAAGMKPPECAHPSISCGVVPPMCVASHSWEPPCITPAPPALAARCARPIPIRILSFFLPHSHLASPLLSVCEDKRAWLDCSYGQHVAALHVCHLHLTSPPAAAPGCCGCEHPHQHLHQHLAQEQGAACCTHHLCGA